MTFIKKNWFWIIFIIGIGLLIYLSVAFYRIYQFYELEKTYNPDTTLLSAFQDHKEYIKNKIKIENKLEKINEMSEEEYYSGVEVSLSADSVSERISRSGLKNMTFEKMGFRPLLPENLPINLYYGDVSLWTTFTLSVGEKKTKPTVKEYSLQALDDLGDVDLRKAHFLVTEYKAKRDNWDDLLNNSENKGDVIFEGTTFHQRIQPFSTGDGSRRMVLFEKDGVWAIISDLYHGENEQNDDGSFRTHLPYDMLLEIAKTFK